MSLTAEEITAIIFDEQIPPPKTNFLKKIFAGKATGTQRNLSLREARNLLVQKGVEKAKADIVLGGMRGMMTASMNVHEYQMWLIETKNLPFVAINNISYSDDNYIGIAFGKDKKTFDPDFIKILRARFVKETQAWLDNFAASPRHDAAKPATPGSGPK